MQHVTDAEMFRACRTLFGPELTCNRAFLAYLQPSGVRSAYRKKAKSIHPDRFAVACSTTKRKQQRLFQDLNQAHETAQSYLKQKQPRQSRPFAHAKPSPSHSQRRRQDPPPKQQKKRVLPRKPLQFGLFLYYQGAIPFQALIAAITWQRKQRPALGEIAKRWGWLDDQSIKRIITTAGGFRRFGERAEHLGLLNSLQVRTLLFHQRSQQRKIGDYFIEQGFFNEAEMNGLLAQLAEHNRTYRHGFNQHYYYFHR